MATPGEYLQTWKLKLSTTNTVSAVFHLNNKEAKREVKVNFNNETLPFCSEAKYLGVTLDRSLTYRRHLANITRRTTEAACWLRLGCWSNNVANSHPIPVPINCRVLRSCLVPQCSYPPHWPRHQRRLANCDWTPASYTSGQPSNPHRHPTCWALSQWSHTISRKPCHGAWTSAPLSTYPSIECRCTASQIETPICTRRTATHQFFWQQLTCGAVGGSSIECRVGGQPHKTPHFNSRHWYTHTRNDSPKKSLGPAQPPPHRCGTFPVLLVQMGYGLRPVSVAQKNKPSTMSSFNVQSIDLPMDCMAWRFWTMRQPNGCSTPAPKSSAAKRWKKELAQKEEDHHNCIVMHKSTKSAWPYSSNALQNRCLHVTNLVRSKTLYQHLLLFACLVSGPLREILPGGTKDDTGPPRLWCPCWNFIGCLHINQNTDKTSTMLRLRITLIDILASGLHF